MEIPFIPQSSAQKIDTSKAQAVSTRKASSAYSSSASASDAIQISSKSKLMQKLRAAYSELEKADSQKSADVKQQLEKESIANNSEDIVNSILKGTIFDSI